MRIAYITAGAAGMYCGSCLHDNTLAAALQRRGHDVALIPTYTPTRTDEPDVSIDRVFYGAVNVYLEQKWPVFERLPAALHWLLDRPMLLRGVSKLAGADAVQGADLGSLTLSILQGEHGHQHGELDRLVDWLERDFHPQLVHITNSMLLGMAHQIRARLGVPIVCSLQGEDIFLEEMIEPWRTRARDEIRARAVDVDRFVAPNRYYAQYMAEYLAVSLDRVSLVPLGITLQGHVRAKSVAEPPFTIGFLARQCPEKGLHHLVEAFRIACEQVGKKALRLHVAGYLGKRDRSYVEQLQERVDTYGLADRVEWRNEVDRDQKMRFLSRLDVLAMPTVYCESKGLPVLEAMASAVPVVVPAHGGFPEMVAATGGGVLVEPESPEALARAWLELRERPERLRDLGERGRLTVQEQFSDDAMAAATERLYAELLGGQP